MHKIHILNPSQCLQGLLKTDTQIYRRTDIEKKIYRKRASRKLNTTSQKNPRGIYISALKKYTWNGRWTLHLPFRTIASMGHVYSYHGYWEFGVGPKSYRRRGENGKGKHATSYSKDDSIFNWYFFSLSLFFF